MSMSSARPSPFPRADLALIAPAIDRLVKRYGHPDVIPIGQLAMEGVPPSTAQKCEALLTSELFPERADQAVAKWLRLIEDCSA